VEITKLPSGDRSWRELLEFLVPMTDAECESDWLERKSQIEVGKTGTAKIAKFILEAANRLPEITARYLDGYAVMVLGIGHNTMHKISRIEDNKLDIPPQ
jgi:hypothetical protein